MPTIKQLYTCSICAVDYPTQAEAEACEQQPVEPILANVGDIVLCKAGFGWYDGDTRWIENYARLGEQAANHQPPRHRRCPNGDGNCFAPCCTYQFYYVVTKIDGDPREGHRRRYHLWTGAMVCGHSNGWTFNAGHYTPRYVVPQPQEIVALGKAFLGREAEYLL